MKRKMLTLLLCVMTLGAWATTETNPSAVVDLVNRVCGTGASSNFTFTLDTEWNGGAEAFQMGGSAGAVTIKANTLSALTCGLNWYLNHEAHVNIAWNNLRQNVNSFPAPTDNAIHTSDGPYRYYLNYCTFSYSMAFWDEDRWMKEIDWMALHGVNISLQIVGVDALWYKMLTQDYSFTHEQASAWIAGPVHQAWWLMDNLSGMGGPNPAEWYTRQAALGKKIVDRMLELGIEPAIPGFIGMVPESIAGSSPYTGTWTSGINCPVVINATQTAVFDGIAKNYYKRLKEIFNYSPKYYANDVMHERGNATGSEANYKAVCDNTRKGMNDYATYGDGEKPTWIAQMWQSNADQFRINSLSDDHTLLLDLSSERTTYKGSYGSKQYLFCMLHNYGGNIGMYGCMQKMLDEYRSHKQSGIANGSNGTLKGVGATPEGIETNPVLYDMLFELPWYGSDINAESWLNDYAIARYGVSNSNAGSAWNRLRTTVYSNTNSNQQGCREPVFCARPNLTGKNASAWAGASYHWDKNEVIEAAYELLSLGSATNATNYDYDVVDFVRQALTDYAHTLQMDMAGSTPYTGARFATQSDGFLQLMRDIDTMLGTVEDFRLGRWVGAARKIAEQEVPSMTAPTGFTTAADWLERNARLLLTTWHDANSAGGLMEYANREYQGLITGYYLPRWDYYFQNLKGGGNGPNSANYYNKIEKAFIYGQTNDANQYEAVPYGTYTAGQATGNAVATAQAMMQKYFGKLSNGKYYSPNLSYNFSTGSNKIGVGLYNKTAAQVLEALNGIFTTKTTGSSIVSYTFDENGDNNFTETVYTDGSLPTLTGARKCQVTTSDGALITIIANFDGDDMNYDPTWPAVTAKDRDSNAASQYVTSLKVNNKTVYTKSSNLNLADEADGPHIIIESLDVPTVAAGQTVTVQWKGTDALKNTYCSVYFDKNANHQFEHVSTDNTECLGYVGTKGGANSAVCNGTVTFTIPENMPEGVTCVRLRFDGAWMESNLANCTNSSISVPCLQSGSNATGTAVNPNHATNRTTYDIHLLVGDVEVGQSAFDDNKYYTLKTARGYIPRTGTSNFNSTTDADQAARFRITYFYGSYYIYNVDLQKYLAANGSRANPYVDTPDGTFRIYPASEVSGAADKWIIHSEENDKWLMFNGDNQFQNTDGWKTADAGDQWIIEETTITVSRTDWPDLTANTTERLNTQWAKQITINGQALFASEQTSDPGAFVKIPVSSKTTIAQDQDLRLGWNFNITGARATVYLDKNADHDFDDAGECIGTVRKFGKNGNGENDRAQNLTGDDAIVIPMSELPLGETVLRVRFDGAWLTPNTSVGGDVVHADWFEDTPTATDLLNPTGAKTYAFLPEIGSTRVAYDIHINVVATEPEPVVRTDWPAVSEADAETNTNQYARKVTVNGTAVAGGDAGYSSHPGYYVKTTVVEVQQGKTFSLGWEANSTANLYGLAYTRATLYLDKNADYDFDDAGECLGTIGAFRTNDRDRDTRTLNISTEGLPLNTETVLRLRFDGSWIHPESSASGSGAYRPAWFTSEASAHDFDTPSTATYAFLPEAGATRVVYDIHIKVVDGPAYPVITRRDTEKPTWWMNTVYVKGEGDDGNTIVYTASEADDRPHITTETVDVERGRQLTIGWTNNDNNINARLSAYCDFNADATFDVTKWQNTGNEILGIGGGFGVASNAIGNKSFTIDLPANMPLGKTRLRLRFDRSNGGDAQNGDLCPASPNNVKDLFVENSQWRIYHPNVTTQGTVFDIVLNVVESSLVQEEDLDNMELAIKIRDTFKALPEAMRVNGVVGNYNAANHITALEEAINLYDYEALPTLLDAIGRTPNSFDNNSLYAIRNVSTNNYLENINERPWSQGKRTGDTYSATNEAFQWMVYNDGTVTVLYGVGSRGALDSNNGKSGVHNVWGLTTLADSKDDVHVNIQNVANTSYFTVYDPQQTEQTDKVDRYYLHENNGYNYGITNWASGADASHWYFVAIGEASDQVKAELAVCIGDIHYDLPMLTRSKVVTTPVAGKRYFIAAQRIIGSKWQDLYLRKNVDSNQSTQSRQLSAECIWTAEAYDGGIAMRSADGLYLGAESLYAKAIKLRFEAEPYGNDSRDDGTNMVGIKAVNSDRWIGVHKTENTPNADYYTGEFSVCPGINHNDITVLYKLYEVDNYDNIEDAEDNNLNPYRIKFTDSGKYLTVAGLNMEPGCGHLQVTGQAEVPDFDPSNEILADNSTVWMLRGGTLNNFMLRSSARRYVAWQNNEYVTVDSMQYAAHFRLLVSPDHMQLQRISDDDNAMARGEGAVIDDQSTDNADTYVEFIPVEQKMRPITVVLAGKPAEGATITVSGEKVADTGNGTYTVNGDAMLKVNNLPARHYVEKWTRSDGVTEVFIPGFDKEIMVTPWTDGITYTAYITTDDAYPWSIVTEANGRTDAAVVGAIYIDKFSTPIWKQEKVVDDKTVFDLDTPNDVQTVVLGDPETGALTVTQGENMMVRWVSNAALADMRLSAFIDRNGDGTFTPITSGAKGDCLGFMGRTGDHAAEYMVGTADAPAGFNITLPIDLTGGDDGLTTLRLRFDKHNQATNNTRTVPFLIDEANTDANGNAVNPDAQTTGMVFDIRVSVKPATVWQPIRVMDRSAKQHQGTFSALEYNETGFSEKIDQQYHFDGYVNSAGKSVAGHLAGITPVDETIDGKTYKVFSCGQFQEGKHYAEVDQNDNWEHWYVTEYADPENKTGERHYHYHMYSMRGTVHLTATPKNDGVTKCLGWWRRIYDNHPGTNPNKVTFTETRISSASDVWVTPSAKTEPYFIEYYTKFAAEIPIPDTDSNLQALPNGDEVVIDGTTYIGVTATGDGAGYTGTTFNTKTFELGGQNYIITEYDPHFLSKNNTVKTIEIGEHVTSVGETFNSYVPHAYYVNHQPKGNGSGSGGTAEDFNGSTYYFEVYNLNEVMGDGEEGYHTLHPDRDPKEGVIMRRPYKEGTTKPIAYSELTPLSVLRDPGDPVYKLVDEAGVWNVRLRYSIPDKYKVGETEYTVVADPTAPTGVKVNGSADAADNNWSFSSHNHFALLATGPDSYDSYNEFNVVFPRQDYAKTHGQNPYLQVQTQVNQSGDGQQVLENRTYYFRKNPLRASTKKLIAQYRDIENIPVEDLVTLDELIGREVELELQYRLGGRLRFNLYTDLGLRACVDVETEAHELRDLMRLCCSMTPGATVEHCTFDYIEDPVDFTRVREKYEPTAEADYKGEPKKSTQNWVQPDNVLGTHFQYDLTAEELAVVGDQAALDAKIRAHYHLDDEQSYELKEDNTKVRLLMNGHMNDAQLRATDVFANNQFWGVGYNKQVAFTAVYGDDDYNDRYSVINMLGDPDAEPIPIDMNWTFDCTFYPVKDKAFNTHGSVILGTGTDGSKNEWPNGFQFYFTYQTEGDTRTRGHATDDGLPGTDSQGYFTLKANSGANVNFGASHPLGNNSQYDFNDPQPAVIHVFHDGDNPRAKKVDNVVVGYEYSTYFKVTQGNRVLFEYTTWAPIHTIRDFCTNVPAGSRIEYVTLHGWKDDRSVPVFAGKAVESIKVDPKNKYFSSHKGALFDKYGHLLLFMPLNRADDLDGNRVLALMKDETECDADCSHTEHIYSGPGNKERHVSLAEVSRKAFRGWPQDDSSIPQAKSLLAVDMFQYGFIECLKPENAALQLDEKNNWTEEQIIKRMELIGTVAEFGRIEINRTLTQDKMNIVSMPFNVSEKEINERYGGWAYELHDIEGVTPTKVLVRLKRVNYMRAGQPYLVKPVAGVKYVSHANTSLRTYPTEQRKIEKSAAVETTHSGETSGVEMQGNYAMKQVPTGVYFYNSANNKFYRYTYDREVILNGFRGTLALTSSVLENNALVKKLDLKRSLAFSLMSADETPGNETAIEELPATVVFTADPIDVYDLNGNLIRKDCTDLDPLENLPRGVYIVGGRKMIKN